MKEIAYRVRATGRVQGVAYRAWAQGQARALGLRGWVRNRGDGSVEALIAGPEDRAQDMVTAMGEGPGAAREKASMTALRTCGASRCSGASRSSSAP